MRTSKSVVLKIGSEGNDVKELQKLLRKAGSTVKVTGKFNIGTYSAVKSFQKKNGLIPNGIADSKTIAKLKKSK